MVTFICESCHSTIAKKQVEKHCNGKCRNAWFFTCIECSKTLEGFEYKEHNECMTEVQRFQGKFLERQREQKQKDKEDSKVKKDEATKNGKKDSDEENEDSSSKKSLRRFLKKKLEFLGWEETAQALLKDRKKSMKESRLKSKLMKVYRLSDEYDDEDDTEEELLEQIERALKKKTSKIEIVDGQAQLKGQ